MLIVDESVQGNTEIVTSHEEEISHNNVVSTINEQDLHQLQKVSADKNSVDMNFGKDFGKPFFKFVLKNEKWFAPV